MWETVERVFSVRTFLSPLTCAGGTKEPGDEREGEVTWRPA